MRISSIILILLVSITVLAIPVQAWVQESTEATGWYYMYDDQSDPPFLDPDLPEMPAYDSIWNDPGAKKISIYSSTPHQYTLTDSFWYYNTWYKPGDYLYITDDGWLSFDNTAEDGKPNPPITNPPIPNTDNPNSMIIPLWANFNTTRDPGDAVTNNRIYYLMDTTTDNFIVEWYQIEGNVTGHVYTFETILAMGGQELLDVNGEEVVFSRHFIHFLYNTTSDGWTADQDPAVAGIEDADGLKGIWYQGTIADGRVIRTGYKGPYQGWVQEPTEETGWYYMYDDLADPPFSEPELPEMPAYQPIWNSGGIKINPYSDDYFRYTLTDSFWYYDQWYAPGDYLYITENGWLSFDNASEDGYPYPPTTDPPIPNTDSPNSLISALWVNFDPSRDPGTAVTNNRLYYKRDTATNNLIVEWYQMEEAVTGHVYTFEAMLSMGGQELLEVVDGELLSYHFIHFLYNTSSDGWTADQNPAVTGIEDADGQKGIWYKGSIADGRVIRAGYKKAVDHDVAADEIIAPETLVEPNTEVDPITVIGNYGSFAESFDVTLNIYDDEEAIVYHHVKTLSDEMDVGVDTIGPSQWPLWTPGEAGKHYIAELIVSLSVDQYPDNDTLTKHVWSGVAVTETKPPSAFELKVDNMQSIGFSIPYATRTELAVYDVNGDKIRTLSQKTYPAGTYTIRWDGCDAKGRKIACGVYLVRMEAGEWETTKKVVIY